jgi:hypothetical protein
MLRRNGSAVVFDIPSATVIGAGMEGFNRPDGISNPGSGAGGSGYGGTPMGTAGAKNLREIGGAQNASGEAGEYGIGTDCEADPTMGQSGAQVITEGSFFAPATPFGGVTRSCTCRRSAPPPVRSSASSP